jgi:1,4-alpha-glucan branching enzyme
MVHLMRQEMMDGLPGCFLVLANDDDKILVFARGPLVFVFNFNPDHSFPGYGVSVEAGKYQVMLNSDSEKYGGFNRIDDKLTYYSAPLDRQTNVHQVKLYLPSRTALVLKRIPTPRVY